MRGLVGFSAAAVLAVAAQGAQAGVVFTDDFSGEPTPGAGGSLNYTGFANFNVIDGAVDLLATPNSYALPGDGNFVDLDGSINRGGQLQTKSSFAFGAGDLVTLSFLAAGNQRTNAVDNLFGGFDFGGFLPTFSFIGYTGFEGTQQTGDQLLGIDTSVTRFEPYSPYSLSFRATSGGSFTAVLGTGGTDNQGPLLDNVAITAVPEPATWAVMILGFFAVGGALRSRRRAVLPAV